MKELRWGETPWDNKTKDELLLDVKRMYAAITSLNSVAHLCTCGQGESPFWYAKSGSGRRALELAKQVLEPIHNEYDSADIYHCYFRYAYDLLFDGEMGFGWYVCSICGGMIGRAQDESSREGDMCLFPSCNGKYRLLTWDDLQPEQRSK